MKDRLKIIYKKLLFRFGPQGWWPAEEPFEVIIGAILTQNTNWKNVQKAIDNIKKNRLLRPDKLYRLSHRRLASLIRPAGYYNIKAKRLKAFLDFFFKVYRADLKKMALIDTSTLRSQLLSINGIGPETADSILLYALGKPAFVIDAYTKRILTRHGLIRGSDGYSQAQNLFMKAFKNDVNPIRNPRHPRKKRKISNGVQLFNEYHALLVKLGKELCLERMPRCGICPLKSFGPRRQSRKEVA